MKISPRVLLTALVAGLLLFVANRAELRWRSFAQFTKSKKEKTAAPKSAPPKSKSPPRKSGGAITPPRRVAPEIEMVYVQGGAFLMGSPENETDRSADEGPQRRVSVPGFYIGKYEVTQAQWRAVMGNNPSYFKGDNLPVEQVSWNDAQEFCRKLSQMTGKTYRLPSEAEWEYAARAGTTGPYAGNLDAMGWYEKNSGGKTQPVGQKQANAWGLFDMHGNVWEWCEDFWHANYNGAPTDGSAWLSGGDSRYRVLRGGSWINIRRHCRSAYRLNLEPDARSNFIGFRVVVGARSP